jgi:hypothetical protein
MTKFLGLSAFAEREIYLVPSSGGSKSWYHHLLGSGEDFMADSITMTGTQAEERFGESARLAYKNPLS